MRAESQSTGPDGAAGPKVVALGGGYGLSTTLRAVRHYAGSITGVVSVADDGGSSGRLRRTFGIPAPGDLRRCLVALAADGNPWADALEHRFTADELAGHPLGNILIAGLTETTGDFGAAIDLLLAMLGATGRVIPATRELVHLKATYPGGEVEGEASIGRTAGLTGVSLVPFDPPAHPDALAAIAVADQIVFGPGSLFTSVLAVLAVPELRQAVAAATGQRVYVANLAEQHPETTGYDVAAHVHALRSHGVVIDIVLHDPRTLAVGDTAIVAADLVAADLVDDTGRFHDPFKLGVALRGLLPVAD